MSINIAINNPYIRPGGITQREPNEALITLVTYRSLF